LDDRDETPGTHPCPRQVTPRRSGRHNPPRAHRWIEAKTEQGFGPQGPVNVETRQATPHLFLQLLHKAQDQLAAYSAAAMKAGVEAAMIEAATIQAAWLIPLIAHVVELARTLPDMDADTILRQALNANDPAVAGR